MELWLVNFARLLNRQLADAGYYLRANGTVIHEDSVGPLASKVTQRAWQNHPALLRESRFWLMAHAAQARK